MDEQQESAGAQALSSTCESASARVDAAIKSSASASPRCRCGQPLPPGGRRLTCGARCKNARDKVLRAIERRRYRLLLWSPLQDGSGGYTCAQVRHEMQALQGEIDALERTLGGNETTAMPG